MNTAKVNWKAVIVYYVLACAISWPFFWWRDMENESFRAWQIPGILKSATYMWGPGLAAIICFFIFRKTHIRTISFGGTSWLYSLSFYWVPLLALAAAGAPNREGIPPHLFPLALGIMAVFTILGEELGWRGFLQDALRPLPRAYRYILIGVLWEAWHFTNRTSQGSLQEILLRVGLFTIFTIVLSFIMGEATDRSKSLIVAVTLHAWVNLVFELPQTSTYIIAALCVPFWAFLLYKWPQHKVSVAENPVAEHKPAPVT